MILDRFINWKKNIEPIKWYGFNAFFHPQKTSFDTVSSQISLIIEEYNLASKGYLNNVTSKYGKRIEIKLGNEESRYIDGRDNIISLNHHLATKKMHERIMFHFNSEQLNGEIIEKIVSLPGIFFAVLYNPYFVFWESNKLPDSYRYKGGLNIFYSKKEQRKIVDISNRPGRYRNGKKINFVGGNVYWMTQDNSAFEYLNETALELEFLESNKITKFYLFDEENYWSNSSQRIISNLKKIINID